MKLYDIFISYKRKSLPIASQLHYRLKLLGYSVFFDVEEMHSGEFDPQLFQYIDAAKDVIVLIGEGALEGWCLFDKNGEPSEDYKTDWFYREVAYSFMKKKNIVPIWVNCDVPTEDDLCAYPLEVSRLVKLQAPNFSLYHVESSVQKMLSKDFIKSRPDSPIKGGSVFKIYAKNKDCIVYNGKNHIGRIEMLQEDPLYYFVERKGQYRFRCVSDDGKTVTIDSSIDSDEEKIVDVRFPVKRIKGIFIYAGLVVIILSFGVSFFYSSSTRSNKVGFSAGKVRMDKIEHLEITDLKKEADNILELPITPSINE